MLFSNMEDKNGKTIKFLDFLHLHSEAVNFVAQRFPGSFPDFMTTAQDGDKVVSLTHRPPLPPGNTSGTHFS